MAHEQAAQLHAYSICKAANSISAGHASVPIIIVVSGTLSGTEGVELLV